MLRIIKIWNHLDNVRIYLEDLFETKWKDYKDTWKERSKEWMFRRAGGEVDELETKINAYNDALAQLQDVDVSIEWKIDQLEAIRHEFADVALCLMMGFDVVDKEIEELKKQRKKK